jgi:ADP-dependent NAD(P)H-hydrate dehydratase / NAD(P)H-hydrate epimerase
LYLLPSASYPLPLAIVWSGSSGDGVLLNQQRRSQQIQSMVVTAAQMREIEARVFAAGMPVAALMEKVGGRIAQRIQALFPAPCRIGVLVGPGHNGGDALVVARELHFCGYEVVIHQPIAKLKELTTNHAQYVQSLGIPQAKTVESLQECDVVVDGLFGFGTERSLEGDIATIVNQINQWSQPVVSIDLPSGLHTDTGAVLGTAIRADRTLCLGLWKLGLLQDHALEYVGEAELIDFDLPLADLQAVLGSDPAIQRTTAAMAVSTLPLRRPPTTHKYKMGHVLLICGSRRYAGGALLTGLGARASGVGMVTIAVPASLKAILTAQLPETLVMGCPETSEGAIAELPAEIDFEKFHAIACGPGLTTEATPIVQQALHSKLPLVLDADGLNILAQLGTVSTLRKRHTATVLTPHLGEFNRLFPELMTEPMHCRITAVQQAAQQTGTIVLLKGARVAIADASGNVRINPASTPALARGGSGDVLTGLTGGLIAQSIAAPNTQHPLLEDVQSAVWWHAQAGILAKQERTELGVDAYTLTQFLIPALQKQISLMG